MDCPDVTDEDTFESSSEAIKKVENWIRKSEFRRSSLSVVAGPQVNRETGNWWVHIQVKHKDSGSSLDVNICYAKQNPSNEEMAQEYSRLRNKLTHRLREADLHVSSFDDYYESVVESGEKVDF